MQHENESRTERHERIDAERGYITDGGIVVCGECRTSARFDDAINRRVVPSEVAAAEPFNPSAGDDWCSVCDRNITRKHREV